MYIGSQISVVLDWAQPSRVPVGFACMFTEFTVFFVMWTQIEDQLRNGAKGQISDNPGCMTGNPLIHPSLRSSQRCFFFASCTLSGLQARQCPAAVPGFRRSQPELSHFPLWLRAVSLQPASCCLRLSVVSLQPVSLG